MLKGLKDKTALVTGGSGRVGKAISIALAKAGVNIIIHYPFSPDETDELRSELTQYKIKSYTIKADFSKPAEYESLIKRSLDITGSLDILVNNASIFSADKMEDANFKDLMLNIEVNAWVPFVLTREFARLTQGSIINILDSKIKGYDWAHTSYILSKHMLSVITKMSALKFAPGVRVNAVAPGLILPPTGKDEGYLKALSATVPLKRHGAPQDIAEAVIYLLKNDFITGQTLFVDGGRHLAE